MKKTLLIKFLIGSVLTIGTAHANNNKLMPQGLYESSNNLIWMRCAVGQTFNGKTCEGTANSYSWFDAKKLAKTHTYQKQTGWRLPTIQELHGLVVCSEGFTETTKIPISFSKRKEVRDLCAEGSETPTLNNSVFPNNPSDLYWSGTADPLQNGYAWYTYFEGGHSGLYNMQVKNYVRLVKDTK